MDLVFHSALLDYKYRPTNLIYSYKDEAVRIYNMNPDSNLQRKPPYIFQNFIESLLSLQADGINYPIIQKTSTGSI